MLSIKSTHCGFYFSIIFNFQAFFLDSCFRRNDSLIVYLLYYFSTNWEMNLK